ncbi:MAG: tyrosine--tRNA ligase [Candidatus Nanoarchaeia archaeon]
MDTQTKVDLIKSFAEEVVTEEELSNLFETKKNPVAYDGFEPSGIAPIHFGLLRATNLKRMIKAGVKPTLYLADYFGLINNKLGGDLDNIRTAGKYFVEVWKACGIETSKVKIVWARDIMDGLDYWDRTLRIAKHISLTRNLRATTIMGRKQSEKLSMAQLFYPPMQVNDIFHMKIDLCQLGMDQRRANMLAREVAPKLGLKKPVAAHHHILMGLQGMQKKATAEDTLMASKMSKSDPKSCIYMHDSYEELKKKIGKAYCPVKEEEGNPLLEYVKHIGLKEIPEFKIHRPAKFGGDVEFFNYEDLKKAYVKGDIHPADLKQGVTDALDQLIKPVREHFEKNKKAKELYETVSSFKITR